MRSDSCPDGLKNDNFYVTEAIERILLSDLNIIFGKPRVTKQRLPNQQMRSD